MRRKSAHGCPDCAQRKRVETVRQIKHVVSRRRRDCGSLDLLTLTIRHQHGDDREFILRVLMLAWRLMTTGNLWSRLRTRFGIPHTVRGIDVTHGTAGSHPHIPALVFARGGDLALRSRLEGSLSAGSPVYAAP